MNDESRVRTFLGFSAPQASAAAHVTRAESGRGQRSETTRDPLAGAVPSFAIVYRAAAGRELLSHRLNRFLHAHAALALTAGCLPLLTPGNALARGAAWWLLHAVLYALSLSALLLGLSSAHAENEEFTWLLGQPAGIAPWLAGKATALAALVAAAAGLLLAPTLIAGGGTKELALVGFGAAGACVVSALSGLALGFWIRDGVRGLISALALWFLILFGTDFVLLGLAGDAAVQAHPDLWVAPLMLNPLDSFRISVLFAVEHSAFTGYTTGRLTAWWVAHSGLWLGIADGFWIVCAAMVAWLGARRRTDG